MDDFSSLFALTPSISILDLNNQKTISELLNNIAKPYDGDVTTINSIDLKEMRLKVKRANYEYGIISNTILDHNDQKTLLKIISMAIRDSGYIIIIEDKNKDYSPLYSLLEEYNYGTMSCVDIFEDYNLFIAQKVHMWGMD